MTAIVNTYLQDVTQNLTGNNDDLLVTSAGSLVETSGEPGVNSTGNFDSTTIDGFVYSAGAAVSITGSSSTLFVNGQVQGGSEGVYIESVTGGDSVNVGSQGSIESVRTGNAVLFEGNTLRSPAATDDRLTNAGDISTNGSVPAVADDDGGGDVIDDSGQISGAIAIGFEGNVRNRERRELGRDRRRACFLRPFGDDV